MDFVIEARRALDSIQWSQETNNWTISLLYLYLITWPRKGDGNRLPLVVYKTTVLIILITLVAIAPKVQEIAIYLLIIPQAIIRSRGALSSGFMGMLMID